MIEPIKQSVEWRALDAHFRELREAHLRDLFAADARRGDDLAVEHDGIYLDYSKNRLTRETVRLPARAGRPGALARPHRRDVLG